MEEQHSTRGMEAQGVGVGVDVAVLNRMEGVASLGKCL